MYTEDVQQGIAVLNELARICKDNNQAKISDDISKSAAAFQKDFSFIYAEGTN
jgi:hypothetical protein